MHRQLPAEASLLAMRGKLGLVALAGFAAASITLGASPAHAVPITYTETVTGASGSLNGQSFSNATVTLSETGDTTNVAPASGVLQNIGTVSITISGFSAVTFTGGGAYSYEPGDFVGFEAPETGIPSDTILLSGSNAAFGTYALDTAIGPITGTSEINSGGSFPTSGGAFILNDVASTVTFTATGGVQTAVPEPSSLALLGVGLLGLGLVRRRRHSV